MSFTLSLLLTGLFLVDRSCSQSFSWLLQNRHFWSFLQIERSSVPRFYSKNLERSCLLGEDTLLSDFPHLHIISINLFPLFASENLGYVASVASAKLDRLVKVAIVVLL